MSVNFVSTPKVQETLEKPSAGLMIHKSDGTAKRLFQKNVSSETPQTAKKLTPSVEEAFEDFDLSVLAELDIASEETPRLIIPKREQGGIVEVSSPRPSSPSPQFEVTPDNVRKVSRYNLRKAEERFKEAEENLKKVKADQSRWEAMAQSLESQGKPKHPIGRVVSPDTFVSPKSPHSPVAEPHSGGYNNLHIRYYMDMDDGTTLSSPKPFPHSPK